MFFSILKLLGLGRLVFSPPVTMTLGVTTILEEGNPPLRKGEVVVPLQRSKEDSSLMSFEVETLRVI